jgi:hypothetical protein
MANSGGVGGGKTVNGGNLKGTTITAKGYPHQKTVIVGGVKQNAADVAKAVATLNKSSMASVGDNPNLAGKNSSSDNVNMLIAKRKQLSPGTNVSSSDQVSQANSGQ